MHFAAIDWFIVVVYLIASVAIGLLGKKYIGKVSHYLVAGRELGTYAGIATLAATESARSRSCTTANLATSMDSPRLLRR